MEADGPPAPWPRDARQTATEASRILVLRGGALGDFIVTLPALALLRRRWPAARIELIGNATAAPLARDRGLLDAVHSQHEARWAALYGAAPLPAELRAWLAGFELVLSYWPDPEGELRRRFPLHAGQRFLSAAALPVIAPAAAHYCTPLRALGLEPEELVYRLTARRETQLAEAERPVIALHPGSGSPRKNWPLEHWAALCGWLQRAYPEFPLVVVSGETEPPGVLREFGTAAHARPLEELVTLFARTRLFLGHDSGVSHLAAACGTRSVLLFGPTEPAMWAPPAPHVTVLQRGRELASLVLPDVQREIARALADRT